MPAGYNIQWTDEMDDLIRLSHETFVSYTSLAQKWGIAHSSVVVRASKLGLCNKDFWTAEEIKILTENWNDKSALQISKMLTGRSRNAVIGKAGRMRLTPKMGWVKPAEDKPKKKRVRK